MLFGLHSMQSVILDVYKRFNSWPKFPFIITICITTKIHNNLLIFIWQATACNPSLWHDWWLLHWRFGEVIGYNHWSVNKNNVLSESYCSLGVFALLMTSTLEIQRTRAVVNYSHWFVNWRGKQLCFKTPPIATRHITFSLVYEIHMPHTISPS